MRPRVAHRQPTRSDSIAKASRRPTTTTFANDLTLDRKSPGVLVRKKYSNQAQRCFQNCCTRSMMVREDAFFFASFQDRKGKRAVPFERHLVPQREAVWKHEDGQTKLIICGRSQAGARRMGACNRILSDPGGSPGSLARIHQLDAVFIVSSSTWW